jgi:hypothetical protein
VDICVIIVEDEHMNIIEKNYFIKNI